MLERKRQYKMFVARGEKLYYDELKREKGQKLSKSERTSLLTTVGEFDRSPPF